jgi:hypothetical protein
VALPIVVYDFAVKGSRFEVPGCAGGSRFEVRGAGFFLFWLAGAGKSSRFCWGSCLTPTYGMAVVGWGEHREPQRVRMVST